MFCPNCGYPQYCGCVHCKDRLPAGMKGWTYENPCFVVCGNCGFTASEEWWMDLDIDMMGWKRKQILPTLKKELTQIGDVIFTKRRNITFIFGQDEKHIYGGWNQYTKQPWEPVFHKATLSTDPDATFSRDAVDKVIPIEEFKKFGDIVYLRMLELKNKIKDAGQPINYN